LLDLLFQGLKSALLPLLFLDQRQEPTDQQDERSDYD
jgi:hypothetical protein